MPGTVEDTVTLPADLHTPVLFTERGEHHPYAGWAFLRSKQGTPVAYAAIVPATPDIRYRAAMDDLTIARNNLHSALASTFAELAGHPGRWEKADQDNAQLIIGAIDQYIEAKLATE